MTKEEQVSLEHLSVNRVLIRKPTLKDKLKNSFKFSHRYRPLPKIDDKQKEIVAALKKDGFYMLENYVDTETLKSLQQKFQRHLENADYETPVVAQAKIDEKVHADLIKRHISGKIQELAKLGITFSKEDIKSYEQVIKEFKPSTLQVILPQNSTEFFNLWLDPYLLQIIESYMGVRPYMVEAYVRRNFPAKYRFMNHFWHRDVNNMFHMMKAFIFLSDCEIDNGPHHYIKGSHNDLSLNHPSYYTDKEVKEKYKAALEVKSIVKAGTVVLEDTRGLHRAGVVDKGFRDLGFAIFYPLSFYQRFQDRSRFYDVGDNVAKDLNRYQRSFISRAK